VKSIGGGADDLRLIAALQRLQTIVKTRATSAIGFTILMGSP
jgi:hypothetical protein